MWTPDRACHNQEAFINFKNPEHTTETGMFGPPFSSLTPGALTPPPHTHTPFLFPGSVHSHPPSSSQSLHHHLINTVDLGFEAWWVLVGFP